MKKGREASGRHGNAELREELVTRRVRSQNRREGQEP
jgi:hypothetical protein